MIRSALTTSVNKEMINVKNVNIIMIISYIVIRHHLRSQLIKEDCEGLRTFVITTKDNHLPYTVVPLLNYIIEMYKSG